MPFKCVFNDCTFQQMDVLKLNSNSELNSGFLKRYISIRNPETQEYHLIWKKGLSVDVTKFRISLRITQGSPKSSHKSLQGHIQKKKEVTGPWRQKLRWCRHNSRISISHQKTEDTKTKLAPTVWTDFRLLASRLKEFCSSKPPNLWWFVIVSIRNKYNSQPNMLNIYSSCNLEHSKEHCSCVHLIL